MEKHDSVCRGFGWLGRTALLAVAIWHFAGAGGGLRAQDAAPSAAPVAVEEFAAEGGAKCKAALPPGKWNGKLLIIAHGFIPEGRPLMVALKPEDPVYRKLLDAGWMVAATSYRRNGLVLNDAVRDVEALRAQIAAKHGKPESVVVEGTSMGGFIGALIAEKPPDPSYAGVLGLGAALEIKEPGKEPAELNHLPQRPILFLSTQDEIAGPTRYAEAVDEAGKAVIKPAVWVAARDGHVNLNRQEIGAALDALLSLINGGKIEQIKDATLPPPPHPQTVTFAPDGGSATGRVIDVDPVYGNLTLDFRAEDIAKLGLKKGDSAGIRIGAADAKEDSILSGSTFGDVKQGEWVFFPTADGYTLVCRNFADAAVSAGAKIGSPVTLRKQ